MADLVRINNNDFNYGGTKVGQGFKNDDADIRNLYTIATKQRGNFYGSSPPQSPNLGDKYDNSIDGKTYRWDGDSWNEVTYTADTLQGHEPGTGANDVLLLDNNGQVPASVLPYNVPIGAVIMWNGTLGGTGNKYPVVSGTTDTDWHVCDGTDGTINMQGLFPLCSSTTYPLNSTGGASEVTLTIAQTPKHDHYTVANVNSLASDITTTNSMAAVSTGNGYESYIGKSNNSTKANVGLSSETGGGEAHNNMPPYRAIHFIQRIA